MSEKTSKPHGLWPSPITPAVMASGARLSEVRWDRPAVPSSDQAPTLVWLEGRSGRNHLFAADDGGRAAPRELAPAFNVRGRVGYGGGDFSVGHGMVVFVDGASGRLYRQDLTGGEPVALTPPSGDAAAPAISADGRWVAYIHHDADGNDCVAVTALAGGTPREPSLKWPQVLACGHDFYSSVRWSPDGRHLAFIAWDHPQLPWEGTWLYLARVEPRSSGLPVLADVRPVAGAKDVSIFQPEFSADGSTLFYVSDADGWSHLYGFDVRTAKTRQITTGQGTEYGTPAWVQELRTFAVATDSCLMTANNKGVMSLQRLDLASGEVSPVAAFQGYTDIQQLDYAPGCDAVACLVSASTISRRLVVLDHGATQPRVVVRAGAEALRPGVLSHPRPLSWNSADGCEVHGLYSPPQNHGFRSTGRPPLIVHIHGGPTSQVGAAWRAETQFFTSRGYGVLSVNHRGSTGYGRAYMMMLRGRWGELDVEDAVVGARYLVERGEVDGERMVIMGASAGGYTTLQAMVTYPEVFAAGVVLYGVANQFTLAADTHKFEAHYSEWLLGPLPEAAPLYRQRSPVYHAAAIRRPLAIFQGRDDKVVPPSQAEAIVHALKRHGIPHVYHVYDGEGHGFRRAETVMHFYAALEGFLREHVLFR